MQKPIKSSKAIITALNKYNSGEFHGGVDIAGVPEGTPIYPIFPGKVIYSGKGRGFDKNEGYGWCVVIKNSEGPYKNEYTTYGHMNGEPKVNKNDIISDMGTILGGLGNSGRSTGPHLHIDINPDINLPKSKRRIINHLFISLYNISPDVPEKYYKNKKKSETRSNSQPPSDDAFVKEEKADADNNGFSIKNWFSSIFASDTIETENRRLSKNFTLDELIKSHTAKEKSIDNTPGKEEIKNLEYLAINVLQPLRDYLNKPIYISSGFRSDKLNKEVGGAKESQHKKGEAVDISVPGMTTTEIIRAMREAGIEFDQAIEEFGRWVHVSYSKGKNRNNILQAYKEEGKTKYRDYNPYPAQESVTPGPQPPTPIPQPNIASPESGPRTQDSNTIIRDWMQNNRGGMENFFEFEDNDANSTALNSSSIRPSDVARTSRAQNNRPADEQREIKIAASEGISAKGQRDLKKASNDTVNEMWEKNLRIAANNTAVLEC